MYLLIIGSPHEGSDETNIRQDRQLNQQNISRSARSSFEKSSDIFYDFLQIQSLFFVAAVACAIVVTQLFSSPSQKFRT